MQKQTIEQLDGPYDFWVMYGPYTGNEYHVYLVIDGWELKANPGAKYRIQTDEGLVRGYAKEADKIIDEIMNDDHETLYRHSE